MHHSHQETGETRNAGERKKAAMPVILWSLGVPVIVIIGLMLTHVI
jgi:hypothetical protein